MGRYAISSKYLLSELILPDTLVNIGERAFYWDSGLTEIVIPEKVTTIGDYAFSCCMQLKSVTIPAGVTSIGDSAFDSCNALKTVYFGGTQEQWKNISIGINNDYLLNAEIIFLGVPEEPEEPSTEEPSTEEPSTEEPATEPATEKPATDEDSADDFFDSLYRIIAAIIRIIKQVQMLISFLA